MDGITTTCGNCGEKVELSDALSKGRQAICPHCGTVLVRGQGAQTRVDIPGMERTSDEVFPERVGGNGESLPRPVEYSQGRSDSVKLRKVLHLRPSPPPPSRKLYDSETRVKMYEQMKHRMWRRKALRNIFDVLILLGLLFSMWFIYKAWDSHLQHKRELAAAEAREAEARAAEQRRFQMEERERERARQEASRAAERAEREKAEEARRQAEKMRKEIVETYKVFTYALRENEFDLFSKVVTNDLQTLGGELVYLLPTEGKSLSLYWMTCPTNGEARVRKIDEQGNSDDLDMQAFSKRIELLDYLVAKEGKVYYRARRRKPIKGKLDKETAENPAVAFFGGLYKTLEILKPAYDDLVFDVVFYPKNSKKKIVCETLEFGCSHSPDAVREAVEKEYPPRGVHEASFKPTKFKRTVKFWDGGMIKQGVDGITYVPRTAPSSSHYYHSNLLLPGYNSIYHRRVDRAIDNHERWASLRDRAQQEDAEEAAFYERLRQSHDDRNTRRKTAAEQEYAKRIDGIIRDGELFYQARKIKPGAN